MRAHLVHLVVEPPANAEHFGVEVAAYLGPADGQGADLFELTMCTPTWLAENVSMPKGFAFLRHHLVVERWDEGVVSRAVRDLCLRTEDDDWTAVATRLSRYAYWEFEDYREA